MARRLILAAAVAAGLTAGGGAARAETAVKLTLDWKFQGPTGFFLLADDRGYYKQEGLAVTIDTGQGSGGAVTRVASGAYEFGFADVNSLIEYDAANPDKAIKAVMIVYDGPPFSVFSLKGNGIDKPADLVGRSLGAPVFDASFRLFPAFAQATGIDQAKVVRKNMDPALREAMLVRHEVDAITGHYFTSYFDLRAKGVKPADMVVMRYADAGLDFYGNSILAAPKMLQQPALVAGFIRASLHGLLDTIRDPDAAVAAALKRDPLIDAGIERERLQIALDQNILTPTARAEGIGNVHKDRLQRSIDQVAASIQLPAKVAADTVFTDAFLPPAADRQVPR